MGLLGGSMALAGPSEAGEQRGSRLRLRQHNVNVSLVSGDPVRTLGKAERVIGGAGGQIEHSNGSDGSANLSARIPPSRVDDVLSGLRRISGKVTNVNRGSSDMAASVQQTKQRLADLELAQAALNAAMAEASPDERRGLVVLFELAQREQRSAESTLTNLELQTSTAVVNVSIGRAK
ncbi:MAG: DUF4349 domain-containing protein [Myxococcota bacterium]